MKTPRIVGRLLAFAVLALSASQLFAQGTAFTYQGRLNSGTGPANGLYDFRFRLAYDALGNSYADGGAALTTNGVAVSNGLFTAAVDFGANVFTGSNLFLEIGIRTNGGSSYTTLTPLQPLTPTPYAITASNVTGTVAASQLSGTIPAGQLAGTYPGQLTLNNPANNIAGTFTGDGGAISNVNARALGGLTASNFWQLAGNNIAPGQFLGTINNQPLELQAGGQRAVRIEPTSNAPNIIGGWSNNFVAPGVVSAFIGGGAGVSIVNGGLYTNAIYSAYGTIGGGLGNTVGNPTNGDVTVGRGGTVAGGAVNAASGIYSGIVGGNANKAQGDYSFIGGGYNNVTPGAGSAVVGGGYDGYYNGVNSASGGASFVGSGLLNTATSNWSGVVSGIGNQASGLGSFVGGGGATATNYYNGNIASGMSSAIPGGVGNQANGKFSFAAGFDAIAQHDSSFVWADSSSVGFSSTTSNEFSLRAMNGVHIQSDKGIHLTAADRPMIVRDWDVFATNAPSQKAGIGRWGLFMEPSFLTIGIPSNDVPYRYFQVAEYSTNGVAHGLMTVDQNGTVYAGSFSGAASNLYNIDAGGLIGTIPTWVQSGFQYPWDYVGGGYNNFATNYTATIVNGNSNTNTGALAFIGSGYMNDIDGGYAAVITGGFQNSIGTNCYEGTISGGANNVIGTNASQSTIGGGYQNTVGPSANQATIAGGIGNQALAEYATVGGGNGNIAAGDTSVISGGVNNQATNWYAVVNGGAGNVAGGFLANVGGGQGNMALANNSAIFSGLFNTNYGVLSFLGSGSYNLISGYAATIPGGISNFAYGNFSFAAGYQAQAFHQGAFVWADSQPGYFGSTTNDEFNIRSYNGVRMYTDRGIHLNAADRPMLVRDWDVFATNAPTWKAGMGRWGMFMEPLRLTMGIPAEDVSPRYFQIAKYFTNGNYQSLLMVDQNGYLYASNSILLHTAGPANVFTGLLAGSASGLSGQDNAGFGSAALQQLTTGSYNVAVGAQALNGNNVGIDNTAVGAFSLVRSTNGNNNVALGDSSMYYNTSGSQNTAVGAATLDNNTNGNNNIAIGYSAGSQLATGALNIYIGNQGNAVENRAIRIGTTQTNTYVAGVYGATAASGVAVYVNSSGQLGTLTSSAKYKKDIQEMNDASEALYSLKPVTFKYKDELDPSGTPQFGLVAEQVEKVDPTLVAHDEKGGIYTVRYQAVDAMLLNEFLKEHKKVKEQEVKLSKQDAEIQALKESLLQLQKTVSTLK